ncbi:MaoC family dehydratase [Nesterenkonia haasae]|uniref:MaoC family dehydratase n=1 Tax=Nesterenkonia haasae TaxID=2587813 RepID=UPI00139074DD|nr:MaoC family dehydratase [Nesterenkonia haasae]NDK32579.1 MaoC family dehydratase [Nesterenkonia haasae]
MPDQAQKILTAPIGKLPELAGAPFGPSAWHTITQEDIRLYAEVSGDHNPIHVDPEAAKKSPFGTVVAHGYLTLSRVVPLMKEIFKITEVGSGINYGLDRLRFPAPVPANSRVRLLGEISEVREIDGGYQVHISLTWELEGSRKPAAIANQVLRFYR